MHIVFLTNVFPVPGEVRVGSGNYVSNMARILKDRGHRVTVITESAKCRVSDWNGITIRKVNVTDCEAGENAGSFRKLSLNVRRSIRYNREVERVSKTNPVDIVQSVSAYGLALIRNRKIPYVVRVSEYPSLWRNSNDTHFDFQSSVKTCKLFEKTTFWALKCADQVLAPSLLLQGLIHKKTGVVPRVVESPVLIDRKMYPLNEKKLEPQHYLLNFGSQMLRKEIHIMANIVDRILDEYPSMKFVVVGRNRDVEYQGRHMSAARLYDSRIRKHRDRFLFLGEISDRDRLYSLIQNSYACVLPTRVDNLPNTCLEAMALGKIVISTTSEYGTSMEQLITDSYNGFLANVDDEIDLLKKIRQAMSLSSVEKKQYENRAYQRVGNLTPQKVYPIMMKVYKETICNFRKRKKRR